MFYLLFSIRFFRIEKYVCLAVIHVYRIDAYFSQFVLQHPGMKFFCTRTLSFCQISRSLSLYSSLSKFLPIYSSSRLDVFCVVPQGPSELLSVYFCGLFYLSDEGFRGRRRFKIQTKIPGLCKGSGSGALLLTLLQDECGQVEGRLDSPRRVNLQEAV